MIFLAHCRLKTIETESITVTSCGKLPEGLTIALTILPLVNFYIRSLKIFLWWYHRFGIAFLWAFSYAPQKWTSQRTSLSRPNYISICYAKLRLKFVFRGDLVLYFVSFPGADPPCRAYHLQIWKFKNGMELPRIDYIVRTELMLGEVTTK